MAGVAEGGQVLANSWQPKEAAEEGGLDLEVVGEGSRPLVGVEVEVGYFQSPEKTEYKNNEKMTFVQLFNQKPVRGVGLQIMVVYQVLRNRN